MLKKISALNDYNLWKETLNSSPLLGQHKMDIEEEMILKDPFRDSTFPNPSNFFTIFNKRSNKNFDLNFPQIPYDCEDSHVKEEPSLQANPNPHQNSFSNDLYEEKEDLTFSDNTHPNTSNQFSRDGMISTNTQIKPRECVNDFESPNGERNLPYTPALPRFTGENIAEEQEQIREERAPMNAERRKKINKRINAKEGHKKEKDTKEYTKKKPVDENLVKFLIQTFAENVEQIPDNINDSDTLNTIFKMRFKGSKHLVDCLMKLIGEGKIDELNNFLKVDFALERRGEVYYKIVYRNVIKMMSEGMKDADFWARHFSAEYCEKNGIETNYVCDPLKRANTTNSEYKGLTKGYLELIFRNADFAERFKACMLEFQTKYPDSYDQKIRTIIRNVEAGKGFKSPKFPLSKRELERAIKMFNDEFFGNGMNEEQPGNEERNIN